MTLPYLAIYYASFELHTATEAVLLGVSSANAFLWSILILPPLKILTFIVRAATVSGLATYILSADIGCITCGERREHRFMSYLN